MLDQYVYVYVLTARVRERNEMMFRKIIADSALSTEVGVGQVG